MSRQSLLISGVLTMGLGLGQVPKTWAQAEVTPAPTQSAPVVAQQQQSPPVVVNNSAPARDTVVVRSPIGPKMLAGGAVLFGVSYAVTAITAAAMTDVCNADSSLGCRDARWPLYIPVAGPFIQMGYVSGTGSNTAKALLAVDGVVQGTGLTMMIVGAVLTAKEHSRSRYAFAPYAGGGTIGLVSMGRF